MRWALRSGSSGVKRGECQAASEAPHPSPSFPSQEWHFSNSLFLEGAHIGNHFWGEEKRDVAASLRGAC